MTAVETVIEILTAAGFTEDGRTPIEKVRIPTTSAPVFGGLGGKLATLGGRLRFARGDERVTVGPRTTCFFSKTEGLPTDFHNISTKDTEAIRRLALRQDGR